MYIFCFVQFSTIFIITLIISHYPLTSSLLTCSGVLETSFESRRWCLAQGRLQSTWGFGPRTVCVGVWELSIYLCPMCWAGTAWQAGEKAGRVARLGQISCPIWQPWRQVGSRCPLANLGGLASDTTPIPHASSCWLAESPERYVELSHEGF